jgi:hypothetical protein
LNRTILATAIVATFIGAAKPSHSFCFAEAGKEYGLAPELLYSVAKHESGLNPTAVNWNTNGSYDFGVMQINSVHAPELKRAGIPWSSLADPCTNVRVGAWILSRCFAKYGQTWEGVGCYNSQTPSKRDKYARQVAQVYNLVDKNKNIHLDFSQPNQEKPEPISVVWNDKTTIWEKASNDQLISK